MVMKGTVPYHKARRLKGFMRENGPKALGGLAQRLTAGLARRAKGRAKSQGGSLARLKAEWPAIAGPELARISQPEALLSARGRSGKALRLRVPGAAALEVQHRSGQLVERVNAYFGHKMIDDIRLVQGALATRAAPPSAPRSPRRPRLAPAVRRARRRRPARGGCRRSSCARNRH